MARRLQSGPQGCLEWTGVIIAVLILIALCVALQGWIIMVLFGAVSSIFGWGITLAYGEAIVVSLALGIVGSFFKSTRTS